MKNLAIIFGFFLLVVSAACAAPLREMDCPQSPEVDFVKIPIAPIQPDPVIAPLEKVVNTPPVINKFVKGRNPIKRDSAIGVMDFRSSGELGSGNLVSDTFSINFFQQGLRVVERQNIRKIVEEQKMAATGMQRLTEEEIAQRIGQLTRADFIVFGAVTQYHFENKELPIPYTISHEALKKYAENLAVYRSQAASFLNSQNRMDEEYYKYIEGDLFCQMYANDNNYRLHSKKQTIQGCAGPETYYIWDAYKSAQNLRLGYPYFSSRKVLPVIGVKQKELDFKAKNLDQDIEEWKVSLKSLLERYDKGVSRKEYSHAWHSYRDYVQEGIEDDYIKNVKRLCRDIVTKLRVYNDLQDQLKACKMRPIPGSIKDFELPKPEERFVTVGNIGITFKIIDVKTGDIIWICQASKRDTNIQKGLNDMVSTVVKDILSSARPM